MADDNIKQVFNRLRSRSISAYTTLPRVLAKEAVQWSQDSFDRQGWLDESVQPWQQRKKTTRKNNGKAILIQSGRLRKSIREMGYQDMTAFFGSDVPYAYIHNYGGTIVQAARSETFVRNRRVRGKLKGRFKKGVTAGEGFSFSKRSINMPQRKFIGNSRTLRSRLIVVGRIHLLKKLT